MHYRCAATLFFLLSLYCAESQYLGRRSGRKMKRIIDGLPLDDYHTPDSVTEYFVWISNPHSCTFYDSFYNFMLSISLVNTYYGSYGYRKCAGINPNHLKCGGALLTPRIVQTACHCLGYYVETGTEWWRYVVNDGFSDKLLSFVGSTATEDMGKGYFSKKFFIHQKCAKHSVHGDLIYDHGIMVLQTAVTVETGYIFGFAPIYKEKDMAYLYYKLISEQAVCLFVGYGRYKAHFLKAKPSVMQHTWRTIRSYVDCHRRWEGSADSNITWYCHTNLRGKSGQTSRGDSGSPVTCNNAYVAAHNWGLASDVQSEGGAHALLFSTWENAAEHRNEFVQKTYEMTDSNDHQ